MRVLTNLSVVTHKQTKSPPKVSYNVRYVLMEKTIYKYTYYQYQGIKTEYLGVEYYKDKKELLLISMLPCISAQMRTHS
jgi:hypothetical protein